MKYLARASIAALLLAGACKAPQETVSTPEASPDALADTSAASAGTSLATPPADPASRVALFGDLHVHTGRSFDAFISNVRATPEDAYRFAKGEKLRIEAGYDIQLGSPLDFLAVTDHGEYLGIMQAMATPGTPLSQTAFAKTVFGPDAENPAQSFQNVGLTIVSGDEIEEIYDRDVIDSAWHRAIEAAEKYYEPGKFTTFSGYEFTAMTPIPESKIPAAANLHRNVIFRGQAPDRLFSTLDSTNPEDLWSWMDAQRAAGLDVMSIPHNSNASNGEMFASETYEGGELTADYAETRMRNEPVMEITQIKGTSEAYPSLSPNDEWANFELYETFIGSAAKSSPHIGDYARTALARGLGLDDTKGFNPFRFGFIGSSDTHIGAGPYIEEKFWGKFPGDGASAEARHSVPPEGAKTWDAVEEKEMPDGVMRPDMRRLLAASQYSASGLAGVWADENTREAIFDAIRRKETFGTSGPRIRARMFAGFNYDAALLSDPDLVAKAYAAGVPQGSDLIGSGDAPEILAWAMRDPDSYPLQRLQVVKVWTDADGAAHEAVYDAACAGGALPDPATARCPDNGATVNLADCSTNDETGAGEIKALWKDPDFDPVRRSAYYVRVLENPSCRWSTWDAVRNGTPPNPDMPVTLQERAWTSPVWYNPPA